MNNKVLKICIFIALFFSSIVGAQIFGLSLNKICLIPLYAYLFAKCIKGVHISKRAIEFAAFFFSGTLSAILSLTADYSSIDSYVSKSVFYAVQNIIIYIPLLFLMCSYSKRGEIFRYVSQSVVWIGRINVVVALVEMGSFFVVDVAFTNTLLKIFYRIDHAAALINLGPLGIFIRPTGLNMDPAFLGIILVSAFIFERDLKWKMAMFATAAVAMSRTALIIIVVLCAYDYLKKGNWTKVNPKTITIAVIIIVAVASVILTNPKISNQLTGMFSRFNFVAETRSEDVGTMRHLLYIPKSIEVFITKFNPIQWLFGFGPRQSGTILAHSNTMNLFLNPKMFTTSWTIECDFAELLLGHGLIGFVLYYICVAKICKMGKYGRRLGISIFLYSVMYDISASTYVLLIMMIFICCYDKYTAQEELIMEKKKRKFKWRMSALS